MNVFVCLCGYLRAHVYARERMCLCVCAHVCVYTCVYVCKYVCISRGGQNHAYENVS